jgi:hypothetical protein
MEAPEALQEEYDAPADVSSITLPSAPQRGLSSLIAYLYALAAPAARQQRGRNKRVMMPNDLSMETPQDILTLKHPDLYIRCMSV